MPAYECVDGTSCKATSGYYIMLPQLATAQSA